LRPVICQKVRGRNHPQQQNTSFSFFATLTRLSGFAFDAEFNNVVFPVTVPPGGVKRGDIFFVERGEIAGEWNDGLFDMFRHGFFHPALWNALCCPQVLMSQVQTRLTSAHSEVREKRPMNYNTVLALFLLAFFLDVCLIMPLMELRTGNDELASPIIESNWSFMAEMIYVGYTICITLYSLVLFARLRAAVRNRFTIGRSCAVEDLCCSCCCHACAIAQLARQTADYHTEEAACCTTTGLRSSENINLCTLV
jgi:Cys-rich protein (TIGR01571 family)